MDIITTPHEVLHGFCSIQLKLESSEIKFIPDDVTLNNVNDYSIVSLPGLYEYHYGLLPENESEPLFRLTEKSHKSIEEFYNLITKGKA